MKEIWKDIVGFPDYHISNLGRVKSTKRNGERILKCHINPHGYWNASLGGNSQKVHRLLAKAFIPNPLNLPQVNHKNGIKTDNRLENLEWVTNAQNVQHAYDTGLRIPTGHKGTDNWKAKITEKQVVEIRLSTLSTKTLSERYSMSTRHINRIKIYDSWKHVK